MMKDHLTMPNGSVNALDGLIDGVIN